MEFGRRQLEKYGWTDGRGLGKHETGIKEALKPKIKLNKSGIGHDPASQFTYHWWENAFDSAAGNLNIENTKDGVAVKAVSSEPLEILTVKRVKIKDHHLQYGSFIKRATLVKEGSVLESDPGPDPVAKAEEDLQKLPPALSDDELFAACGGLTAHKAARHGLRLSGKLQRVKEQEEALLRSFTQPRLSVKHESVLIEKEKKSKKRKVESETKSMEFETVTESCKKKRKKKEKREKIDSLESNCSNGSDFQVSASSYECINVQVQEPENVTNERPKKKKKKKLREVN